MLLFTQQKNPQQNAYVERRCHKGSDTSLDSGEQDFGYLHHVRRILDKEVRNLSELASRPEAVIPELQVWVGTDRSIRPSEGSAH
jgi:hypothetical protein